MFVQNAEMSDTDTGLYEIQIRLTRPEKTIQVVSS
jgi:hypothetical protein